MTETPRGNNNLPALDRLIPKFNLMCPRRKIKRKTNFKNYQNKSQIKLAPTRLQKGWDSLVSFVLIRIY